MGPLDNLARHELERALMEAQRKEVAYVRMPQNDPRRTNPAASGFNQGSIVGSMIPSDMEAILRRMELEQALRRVNAPKP